VNIAVDRIRLEPCRNLARRMYPANFKKDSRYNPDAYYFVRKALSFTQDLYDGRHVTGPELLKGIRRYALRLFANSVATLEAWVFVVARIW